MQADGRPIELSDHDLESVSQLLVRVFGGRAEWYLAYFMHWWNDNPVWNRDIPRGWLIKSASQEAIAFTANIPFAYSFDGAAIMACATGSTAVDERWRGRGLSKRVGACFLDQPAIPLLIGNDSTETAYRMWLSLGMTPLKRSWPHHSYCLIGSVSRFANAKLKDRIPSWAVNASAGIEKAVGESVMSLTRRRSKHDIHKIERFEARHDDSLAACRASTSPIYAVRDAETLNWLYFGPHIHDKRAVFAAKDGEKIIGYAGVKLVEHFGVLLECRTRDLDPDVAHDLLIAVQEYAIHEGLAYIRIWRYTPLIEEAASRLVGRPSHAPMPTCCYKANGPFREEDWEATPGDGDLAVN